MGAMGPAVQNGSQNTGAKGMGSNSSNGRSSVGAPTGKGMSMGNGNITYPGQGGQPAMGQASASMQQGPNGPVAITGQNLDTSGQQQVGNAYTRSNPYQNTIQPWNVSGMTGQNTHNFHAGKGKGT